MLVALQGTVRTHAASASKGPTYHCPGCRQEVTLKKGVKVVHHFAHKPPVSCAWAAGETLAHLGAKNLFLNHFAAQGYEADVEYPIGSQRADVHVVGSNGTQYVFEMQHQPITSEEIAARTDAYFQAGAVVTWLPLIDIAKMAPKAKKTADGYVIERYTPKPFERWLHGFHFKELWFVDASTGMLWRGQFDAAMLDVPYSEWHVSGGGTESAGGYTRFSKRWRKLTLVGPYPLGSITFGRQSRAACVFGGHRYPAGARVTMTPK